MLQRSFTKYFSVELVCHNHSIAAPGKNVNASTDEEEYKNARPYRDIPGPSVFQFILGSKKPPTEFFLSLRKQYGDIVKMPTLIGKKSVVLTFDTQMYQKVFRNEGVWPVRQDFDAIEYHRKVHRKDFFQGVEGLLMSSGESWSRFRSIVHPILVHPKNIRLYLNKMLEVSNEFLLRIREIRDPFTKEVPDTFADEIHRMALESVSVLALDKQLGLIRRDRDNPETTKLFKNIRTLLELAYEIEVSPISWQLIKTPKFHRTMKVADEILETVTKHINHTLQEIDKHPYLRGYQERSIVEKLLKIDKRIAILMAMDLLMAGVETTSSTLAGLLLIIAKNPEKQEKLRQELRSILPQKDSLLTIDNMQSLPYLRACIKEGIRLYPVSVGVMRTLSTDLILGGYQVPRGVGIHLASNLLMRDEQYFPKPNEFIPERWLSPAVLSNPFVYIPFGFGPRGCAGKQIAELELELSLARLVRNFHIGFDYPTENAFKAKFFNVPAIPLKFSFTEVED